MVPFCGKPYRSDGRGELTGIGNGAGGLPGADGGALWGSTDSSLVLGGAGCGQPDRENGGGGSADKS